MKKSRNIFKSIHKSTRRNYLERMLNQKSNYMKIAKKYSVDYWDGDRASGYGGYRYIEGYWDKVIDKLIKFYKLNNKSKILDVGCGKGFLLNDIKKRLPNIEIRGIDISRYAINKAPIKIKKFLKIIRAQDKYPFKNKYFDLVISFGCIHNLEIFDIKNCLSEISRVGKKQFIMTESYRNNKELFNLQCWALTCESFFSPNEWKWIFKEFKYDGDYELIFFE